MCSIAVLLKFLTTKETFGHVQWPRGRKSQATWATSPPRERNFSESQSQPAAFEKSQETRPLTDELVNSQTTGGNSGPSGRKSQNHGQFVVLDRFRLHKRSPFLKIQF